MALALIRNMSRVLVLLDSSFLKQNEVVFIVQIQALVLFMCESSDNFIINFIHVLFIVIIRFFQSGSINKMFFLILY